MLASFDLEDFKLCGIMGSNFVEMLEENFIVRLHEFIEFGVSFGCYWKFTGFLVYFPCRTIMQSDLVLRI